MSFTSMATSLTSSTEQPLSPRSPPPPGLLDFYGKRKQMVKIQVLEREIALLQEELKSLEGLHPASRCCKELDTFVGSGSDPFTSTNQTISKSHGFWKHTRLRLLGLVSLPWVCCSRCCLAPRRTLKGCCRSGGRCWKTKTVRCCCNVVKPCGNCLVCFSCDCYGHNRCHRCCLQ
ncbi:guanine nucleotide-binding protein subunit gamma 3 isoform X1 [Neltuma alba]|uniref:guanine nucleotide-binding protein subunit gamma 3 isoform X1 n=1 Tax=Neltuma alba TaxID=207710 RepID=UPI0010A370E2|nr:guanine nucleotide-binding protein subunit gamma 3-like isoform X1 [Prosopis alba]